MNGPAPRLVTPRLWLRLLQDADAAAIQRLAGDRRIAANTLNIPHPYPAGAARRFIAKARAGAERGDSFTFAILRRADSVLTGVIGLRLEPDSCAEVGYWTGVPWQGRGYMSEALPALISHGFTNLGLQRIQATHFVGNEASGRVMRKAGMRYESALPRHVQKWGHPRDLLRYRILRAEFEAAG